MPRHLRPALLTVFAAAAATVLVPLIAPVSAAACPSFADSPTDGAYQLNPGSGVPPTTLDTDPSLEITNFSAGLVGDAITFRTTVKKLAAGPAKHTGDNFETAFTIGGKAIETYAFRYNPAAIGDAHEVPYNNTGLYLDGAYKSASKVTATYDLTANAVTVSVKLSELTALGVATTGSVSELSVIALGANSRISHQYDTASGGAATFSTATACSIPSAPGPTTSASPTATPTATPTPTQSATPTPAPTTTPPVGGGADVPTAGCEHFADVAGDGTPIVIGVSGNNAALPNDRTLDIRSATFRSDDKLTTFIKVDKFSSTTANGNGPRYEWTFSTNGKVINLFTQIPDAVAQQAIDAQRTVMTPAGFTVFPNTGGKLGTTYDARLKVTSSFDAVNNLVRLGVEKASVETVVGAPVTGDLTTLTVHSRMVTATGGFLTADTAPTPAGKWTVGDNKCFAPPPGVLTNVGATAAQYGDAATVAAKLTDAAGQALAGRTVRFAVGTVSRTAVTGSDGVARTSLMPAKPAAAYSLVASFEGDTAASEIDLATPFKVVVEKTKVVLSVAKSGVRRTVTAKLLDDDGKAVAGQTITWYVNGKKVSSAKTSSTGTATLTSAKPTQTVKVVYAGATGKYAPASGQIKV